MGSNKRWEPEVLDEMEALLKEGLSYREVARRMGVSSDRRIAVYFPGYGKPRNGYRDEPQFPLTPEEKAKVEALLKRGYAIHEVVQVLGVSSDTVRARYPQYVLNPMQAGRLTGAKKRAKGVAARKAMLQ